MKYSYLDHCDLNGIEPGSLNPLNPKNKAASWRVHGEWIQGASNFSHAKMIWFRRRAHNGNACQHCHTPIRYAVALQDEAGKVIVVGEICTEKLERGLDPKRWADFKIARKTKKAKNGRFCYTEEAPRWLWDLRPQPSYISTSKFRPYGSRSEKWYVSIWGSDTNEVVANWRDLQNCSANGRKD